MKDLATNLKSLRRISAPLVAIRTPDPAATLIAASAAINGNAPKASWDVSGGFRPINEAGEAALSAMLDGATPDSVTNPADALLALRNAPRDMVVFMLNLHRFLESSDSNMATLVMQGVWNLRDLYKTNRRMLVILAPSITLPAELTQDVVILDEALPGREAIREMVSDLHSSADLPAPADDVLDRAVDALRGLPMFTAEQVTASSLSRDGVDLDGLWERKRSMIEQTPGLSVYRGAEKFADLGGVESIKGFLGRLINGKKRPKLVVFIDEVEKGLAGATAGTGDNTGVSQDILQNLLTFMEDRQSKGLIFVGPPGAAKSACAKAVGAEAEVMTVQLDLGGLKGSLVGQTEARIRAALQVVSAVSDGEVLFIATCNKEADLPPELKRRFSLGTWFFDLPTEAERESIWKIWTSKYGIDAATYPLHQPYTGAEIRNVCDLADRLGISLDDACQYLVPVSVSGAAQLEGLRNAADGRFLSASSPGVYRKPKKEAPKASRNISLDS
jgi:hypothetical protein